MPTWKQEDGELFVSLASSHYNRMWFYREKYVCVEPGYVRGFVKVEAGQTWIGQQVITAHL